MRRVVFLDVDGTVVNYASEIPASAIRAIREARALGNLVVLVTGRSKAEMYDELWDIGIDGFIGGNGSYVEYGGQVLFEQTLSLAQCTAIVDWLISRGLPFYLEANSGLYGSPGFETAALPAVRAYSAGKGAPDADEWTVRRVFPEMIFDADLYRADVNKISFVLGDYQDFVDAAAAFPELKAGTWGGRGSHALFGDLGVPNIDKAVAIDVFLNQLGIDKANSIAIGDAAVDIPMFDHCGVAVAMGNAPDDVKAFADFATTDVDHDGLHHAFVRLGLIDA